MAGSGSGKKNKKKAALKKEDEKKKKEEEEAQAEEDEAAFQIALLEIRVKDLENLNIGLKAKSEYLETQNTLFKEQLDDTRAEKIDLVSHLQRSFDEAKSNVKEIECRLFGLQQAKLDEAKEYERQLAVKNEEFEAMKSNFEKIIIELNATITSLEDFRMQKDKLEAETADLKSTLEEERARFEREFDETEHRNIVLREKMKRESVEKLKEMAKKVQEAGKASLSATIKSAISQNIQLKKNLEDVSKDNLNLRGKLSKLNTNFKEKRMTIETLQEENSIVHQKCKEFRNLTQNLLERQLKMEKEMDLLRKILKEFKTLTEIHGQCKTKEEIDNLISAKVEKEKKLKIEEFSSEATRVLEKQVKNLSSLLFKFAFNLKEMTEAQNSEEVDILKERFQKILIEIYKIACDLPNITDEERKALIINGPKSNIYFEIK